MRRQKKVKTEKITINLSPTEVGQIDYLVERGLYASRSDFIRMASRKQIDTHSGDINQFLAPAVPETDCTRYFGGLGLFRLTAVYLESLKTFGAKLNIRIVGALSVEKGISAAELGAILVSCKVHGKIFADDEVKGLLRGE